MFVKRNNKNLRLYLYFISIFIKENVQMNAQRKLR